LELESERSWISNLKKDLQLDRIWFKRLELELDWHMARDAYLYSKSHW
jgi:hypothetical protein